jgi:hypothetical protein
MACTASALSKASWIMHRAIMGKTKLLIKSKGKDWTLVALEYDNPDYLDALQGVWNQDLDGIA